MATVIFEEQVEIPADVRGLADFRCWALSDQFPERGRIDFIAGRIEVDMAPEDLFCHGTIKSEIATVIQRRVKRGRLGHLFIDSTRISSPEAGFWVEPDIVFLSHEALHSDRARLIGKASGRRGRYVEIEGCRIHCRDRQRHLGGERHAPTARRGLRRACASSGWLMRGVRRPCCSLFTGRAPTATRP